MEIKTQQTAVNPYDVLSQRLAEAMNKCWPISGRRIDQLSLQTTESGKVYIYTTEVRFCDILPIRRGVDGDGTVVAQFQSPDQALAYYQGLDEKEREKVTFFSTCTTMDVTTIVRSDGTSEEHITKKY